MLNLEITDQDIDHFLGEVGDLTFDEPRRNILKSWQDVQACPGSGKTTLIAAKLIMLAKKWDSPYQGICVLTHTNVACEEIKSRLRGHPAGFKLLTYPHFIGTIQEFINKFIALPSCRDKFPFTRFIDDYGARHEVLNAGLQTSSLVLICNNLRRKCDNADNNTIYGYLNSCHFLNAVGDIRLIAQRGSPINVSAAGNSDRWKMLKQLKLALFKKGIFQYRDMYAIAEKLVQESPEVVESLQHRFPAILIDEMQDTQKFQDELINAIFESDECKMQRVGDLDQAIFDNMGEDEPNETFNLGGQDVLTLNSTNRFGQKIASKFVNLSFSEIGELVADNRKSNFNHSILVYNDESKARVLDSFAELLEPSWKIVKAVGGTEGQGRHIYAYWNGYDRRKTLRAPKPEKLIHCVQRDWKAHSSEPYNVIIDGVLYLLRLSAKLDTRKNPPRNFTKTSLMSWLDERGRLNNFQKLLAKWLIDVNITPEAWGEDINFLKDTLEVTEFTSEFLDYDSEVQDSNATDAKVSNIYPALNGRLIEVSTIHGVKGETHDATLVLETKNYCWDLHVMLPYLLQEKPDTTDTNEILPSKPTNGGRPNKQFMRQLYVAMSRPKHLLCLAIHESHITQTQIDALENPAGPFKWNVVKVA